MFERWRTFDITRDSFKETAAAIEGALQKLGSSKQEAETGRQRWSISFPFSVRCVRMFAIR